MRSYHNIAKCNFYSKTLKILPETDGSLALRTACIKQKIKHQTSVTFKLKNYKQRTLLKYLPGAQFYLKYRTFIVIIK